MEALAPLPDAWDGPLLESFDDDAALGFIGKSLLVGVTKTTATGDIVARCELHGIIVAVTAAGIDVELRGPHDGKTWRMPPWLFDLHPAAAGCYRLRTTGEVVVDPDFLFTMSIRTPHRH